MLSTDLMGFLHLNTLTWNVAPKVVAGGGTIKDDDGPEGRSQSNFVLPLEQGYHFVFALAEESHVFESPVPQCTVRPLLPSKPFPPVQAPSLRGSPPPPPPLRSDAEGYERAIEIMHGWKVCASRNILPCFA